MEGPRPRQRRAQALPASGCPRPHRLGDQGVRTGYVFLHTAIDGFCRLAYTEHLPNEKTITAIVSMARVRAFFAAHGIQRITRVVTGNGSCYRSGAFL
ncbi:hypothetical protein Kisp01_70500 [Kineosporia sp. NBRC 101677]|nr:hypothetical protein Kisp01_70500 [Kineosporia sp. NBRC 101677]